MSNPLHIRPDQSFLGQVWRLTYPYWRSPDFKYAWGLLAVVVGLSLAGVYMAVVFNEWNRDIYNALQDKNAEEFWRQLLRWCWLVVIAIAMWVYRVYLEQMLQIRWRRWLTETYFERWLSDRAFYKLEIKHYGSDNPDQRLAEDLNLFTDYTLSLVLGLMRTVVSLVSFSFILWSVSGSITLFGVEIPGYMFWAALIYAIGGSWLTHIIGRPLIRLNNDRQRFEANLRFNLIRVRENAESIALYDGAADERRALMQRFGDVWDNWLRLMKRQKRLGWFTIFYDYAASPFPLVMAAPQYFTGAIQLGQLMQIANAFGQVQGGLSWFVSAYTTLATWKATTDRILGFHHAVEQARAEGGAIELGRNGDESLQVEGLELALPDGKTLVSQAGFSVRPGERVLVTGPSGSGKSTLFRALAGIWPFGRGRVRLPASGRAFFLPQRPYLPIASLRAALCYPSPEGAFDDAAIREALELCRLSHLSGRLDEVRHWARELSPGEQQRLAVARALLQKPDWLFLDEATSALDEATERQLYQVLSERLPDTTVISIGHRPTLAAFHCRRLHIDGERLRELEPVPA